MIRMRENITQKVSDSSGSTVYSACFSKFSYDADVGEFHCQRLLMRKILRFPDMHDFSWDDYKQVVVIWNRSYVVGHLRIIKIRICDWSDF